MGYDEGALIVKGGMEKKHENIDKSENQNLIFTDFPVYNRISAGFCGIFGMGNEAFTGAKIRDAVYWRVCVRFLYGICCARILLSVF